MSSGAVSYEAGRGNYTMTDKIPRLDSYKLYAMHQGETDSIILFEILPSKEDGRLIINKFGEYPTHTELMDLIPFD